MTTGDNKECVLTYKQFFSRVRCFSWFTSAPNEDCHLANIASARKRAKQAVKNRAQNMALRSRFRTSVKQVIKAIRTGDAEAATTAYRKAVPIIDSTVTKGLIHRNKAARHKSRLNARIRALRLDAAA